MRLKFLIFLFIITILILVAIFWLRPAKPSMVKAPPQTAIIQGNNTLAVASNLSMSNLSPPIPSSAPLPTNTKKTQDLLEKLIEDRNKLVDFHGQVIDQDSNLLSGVKVESVVEQITMPAASSRELVGSQYIKIERITDAGGRFEISGLKGDGFGIILTKDGYEAEPGQRSFGPIGGSYDNPVIFKMWSTNIHEKLIYGNKSFVIVPDGNPYFINLTDDTINQSGQGDLKVWIQYTNHPVQGQIYDWSAGVEIITGGLYEEKTGSPMFEAPTDGYVPAFQVKGHNKGGQRGDIGERQFYLKLNGGQKYGQMTIGLYAPFNSETPGLVRLTYAINPSGSRILR